jgi:signal transduction histidine kinase
MLQWFERAERALEEALSTRLPPEQRVTQIAETMRSLAPGASLYACLLRQPGSCAAAALDRSGKALRDTAARLAAEGDVLIQHGDRALAQIPEIAGHRRHIQPIEFGKCHYFGWAAVALPPQTAVEAETLVRSLLPLLGGRFAAALRVQALEQEVWSQTAKADVGEVAAPLAHELNNWLNALLLHVAVLEQEVPESCRSELSQVRRQSKQLAELIKEWQQYRQAQHNASEPIDANQIVRDTLSEPTSAGQSAAWGAGAAPPVKLALAARLPKVLGSAVDLKRLLRFLLNQTLPIIPAGKTATVRTDTAGADVVLRLEWEGPAGAVEMLTGKLDLSAEREGRDCLEMVACDTLVRRMQGRLRLEKVAKSGNVIVVELPVAPNT